MEKKKSIKDQNIRIRITESQLLKLKETINKEKVSLSSYLREIIDDHTIKGNNTQTKHG